MLGPELADRRPAVVVLVRLSPVDPARPWCRRGFISQWICIRMLLTAAFVCAMSSLSRRLSFMIAMLARASRSEMATDSRDTSSRSDSCSDSKYVIAFDDDRFDDRSIAESDARG